MCLFLSEIQGTRLGDLQCSEAHLRWAGRSRSGDRTWPQHGVRKEVCSPRFSVFREIILLIIAMGGGGPLASPEDTTKTLFYVQSLSQCLLRASRLNLYLIHLNFSRLWHGSPLKQFLFLERSGKAKTRSESGSTMHSCCMFTYWWSLPRSPRNLSGHFLPLPATQDRKFRPTFNQLLAMFPFFLRKHH